MPVPLEAGTTQALRAPANAPPDAASAGAPSALSPAQFRDALSNLATAVSIISTAGPAGMAGVTCSAVSVLSDDPPMVAVVIHRKSAANAVIRANGALCVNTLAADQKDLALLFAGVGNVPMPERFGRGSWGLLATGAPHCLGALLAVDCEIVDARDAGTHTLFIAQAVATAQADAVEPLLHFRRTFGSMRPV